MVDYDRQLGFLGQVNRVSPAASYMSHHRTSPHLSHLDHTSPSPSTPSPPYPHYAQPHMTTMSQQQSSQARQPTSYPSPRSYPSPSMSAYAYPPPQQQQTVEPYRASPTGSHVSLPNLSLPPIRSIDPRPHQQGQAPMGSPLPPPVAQMGNYYHGPGQPMPHPQQHPNITSSPHNQPLRYPLPAPDGRIMSGGRHKKEIKRRTKTGCLTCRKRRIKCDEAHPTCRNCQKSKRECLGYDPIFKAQPSPAAIQPAPSSAPPMTSPSVTAGGGAASYAQSLQGYPAPVPGGFAAALSTGASSPGSSVEPYDYSSAIDPALEAAGPAPHMGAPPNSYDGTQGFRQDLKRGLGSASPYSSAASDTQNSRGGAYPAHSTPNVPAPVSDGATLMRSALAHSTFPAKSIKIDDLLRIGGGIPPPLTPPSEHASTLSPAMLDQIKALYSNVYGPSIDHFLETKWFSTRGLSRLLGDNRLCELFASLIERFREPFPSGDKTGSTLAVTQGLEMRVIWMLMCLCRSASVASSTGGDANDVNGSSEERDSAASLGEAVRRLRVFENLLSGTILDANPADLSRISNVLRNDQAKFRELEFWRSIGRFLTLRDNEASSAKEIDDTLAGCRNLLDNHENRDIIYSIAVVRHIGQRVVEFPNNLPEAVSNDEKDNNNKLRIAKTFIESEANGSATTTVLQRICDLIIKSWTVAANH